MTTETDCHILFTMCMSVVFTCVGMCMRTCVCVSVLVNEPKNVNAFVSMNVQHVRVLLSVCVCLCEYLVSFKELPQGGTTELI